MACKSARLPVLGAIAMFAFAPALPAANPGYDYVEVAYFESDGEVAGVDVESDGVAILLSREVGDHFALRFGYQEEELDFDFDGETVIFGIDYYAPTLPDGDFIAGFSLVDVEVSQPLLGTDDDTGFAIQLGVRNRVSPMVEWEVFVARLDVFDSVETIYGVSLGIGSAEGIQLTLGLSTSDDVDLATVGIRANY